MGRVTVLRTLFLHPPSFQGFDGGAGSRYQARREIRSFWYPTWLAQPAALVPGSRLVDAPPADLTLADVLPLAREYELAVLHTSAPSFTHDVKVAVATCTSGDVVDVLQVRQRPLEMRVAAVVLESVPRYEAAYGGVFEAIEIVSLVVFTVEYLARIWVAAEHAPYREMSPARARART